MSFFPTPLLGLLMSKESPLFPPGSEHHGVGALILAFALPSKQVSFFICSFSRVLFTFL